MANTTTIEELRSLKTLLTVREAAARLGTCVETIRRWGRSGKLPVIRVSKSWRIDPADLASFLEQRRSA